MFLTSLILFTLLLLVSTRDVFILLTIDCVSGLITFIAALGFKDCLEVKLPGLLKLCMCKLTGTGSEGRSICLLGLSLIGESGLETMLLDLF